LLIYATSLAARKRKQTDLASILKLFSISPEILIEKYPWLPMTASIHKLLIHAGDIIENSVHPIRYFGKEGAESRNKFYKCDHARKDVFHRATDSSDPIIS